MCAVGDGRWMHYKYSGRKLKMISGWNLPHVCVGHFYCFLTVFGHPVAQTNEAKHQTCRQTSEYSGAGATVTVPSKCKILPSFCLVSRMFWLIEERTHYREWLEEDEQIFLCGVLSFSLPIQRCNVSDFHGNIAICALDSASHHNKTVTTHLIY